MLRIINVMKIANADTEDLRHGIAELPWLGNESDFVFVAQSDTEFGQFAGFTLEQFQEHYALAIEKFGHDNEALEMLSDLGKQAHQALNRPAI